MMVDMLKDVRGHSKAWVTGVTTMGFAHVVYTCYVGRDQSELWCILGGPRLLRREKTDLEAFFVFGRCLSGSRRLCGNDTEDTLYILRPLAMLWLSDSFKPEKNASDHEGGYTALKRQRLNSTAPVLGHKVL